MQRSILVEIHPETELLYGLKIKTISPVLSFTSTLFKKHNQILNQEMRNENEIK